MAGRWLVMIVVVLAATAVHVTHGECPHEAKDKTFRLWSDDTGWTALGLQKPTKDAEVVIADDVLLDESTPDLKNVVIESGGSLVFSPDGDFTLVTGYLMVYGALHIGSEDCRFQANARIVLKAGRGDFNVEGFGGKFIGVASGATLELHGQNKMAWTKLTSTIPKLTSDNGLVYDIYDDDDIDNWNRGLVTVILDGNTGDIKFNKLVYLMGNSKWRLNNDRIPFFAAMSEVEDGDVIVMAVQKNVVGQVDLEPFFDAIETATTGSVTNSSLIRQVKAHSAWVMVSVKGKFVQEKLENRVGEDGLITAGVMVPLPQLDIVINVQSITRPNREMNGYTVGQAASMNAGARILNLAQDASTWRPGDRLLVTSTDYEWKQTEEGEVTYCSPEDCNANQIRLLMFPRYTHHGEITDGVDMRAEVALLSRNIVIEGAMADRCPRKNRNCNERSFDTYGGHIKIEKDFANVHIEGVELRYMGQLMERDRHPILFHQCRDVDTSSKPAYVKSVSIRDSYSMCVAVSGTSGLTIQDNVAYKHFGPCYALKEGGEKRTVLDGNLGVGTMVHSKTPIERYSTTFLITNPLTYFKNNVAAGGIKRGIWYVFPLEPIGGSRGKDLMGFQEARRTPYLEFTNNAAHSYGESGLYINHELNRDWSFGGLNHYRPVSNPEDSESDQHQAVSLHRFTGFKNRVQNAFVRGGYFIMEESSLSDSARGLGFAWSSNQPMTLTKSIIVGESANTGEPSVLWDKQLRKHIYMPRSIPTTWDYRYPVQGFTVQDGPLHLKSVWFNGFLPNENRSSSAIGFTPTTIWPSAAINDVQGLLFGFHNGMSTGLRFFETGEETHGFGSKDGDLESILHDVDGSLTGEGASTLVKPLPLYTTQMCVDMPEWGMSRCPHRYAKLTVQSGSANNGLSMPILTRDDLSPSEGVQMPFKAYSQFPIIKGGSHSYILHWSDFLPSRFYLRGRGIQRGDAVRLGLCVPRNGQINLYTYSPVWAPTINYWHELGSIQQLDQSTEGGFYFYDRENGIVFVKLMSYDERPDDAIDECVNCPMLRVRLDSGNASDADCRGRIGAYQRPPLNVFQPPEMNLYLPATAHTPPHDFGAGEFVPFRTRQVIDGGYGEWSEWGPCTVTCGGGTQKRSRACDSPMPQNGGRPCSGPSEETQSCGNNPCEIHGQFSDWSAWGSCKTVPGNGDLNGYQTRSRACDDPAPRYNGDVCNGDTKDMQPCLLTLSL